MKMTIIENGLGIHISAENQQEQDALTWLLNRQQTHAMNFSVIGRPAHVLADINQAIENKAFIAVVPGEALPRPKHTPIHAPPSMPTLRQDVAIQHCPCGHTYHQHSNTGCKVCDCGIGIVVT